jgi:hypothetical protein
MKFGNARRYVEARLPCTGKRLQSNGSIRTPTSTLAPRPAPTVASALATVVAASAPNRRAVGTRPDHFAAGGGAEIEAELVNSADIDLARPGWDGVKMQLTSLCDVIIKPMPPEMSQVSVPALTRSACAIVATGDAAVATTARAARTLNGFCISNSLRNLWWRINVTGTDQFRPIMVCGQKAATVKIRMCTGRK